MPPSNTTRTPPRATDAPTGLKPVLDVIPAHCYERSTVRGLGLFAHDAIIFGLSVWGLLSTNNPILLVPLWLLSGVMVAGLFVIGHDAAHGALFDSQRLNAVVARLSMLPSLHAVEVWVFGRDRVHHGHTLRQGMDFVWHPLTVEQYDALGRFAKLRHKLEWGPFGVWHVLPPARCAWNKMVRFPPPTRWARRMRRDQAFVLFYAIGTLAALVAVDGTSGVWQWIKVVVIPFLLFCQLIGWVVHVHHIAPEIRWWPRREWNRFTARSKAPPSCGGHRAGSSSSTGSWSTCLTTSTCRFRAIDSPKPPGDRRRLPRRGRRAPHPDPRLSPLDEGVQAPRLRNRHVAHLPHRWLTPATLPTPKCAGICALDAHLTAFFGGFGGPGVQGVERGGCRAGRGRAVDGGLPREPVDLLALTHGRGGVGISTVDEIAQVDACVPTARVYVDVDQLRNTLIVDGAAEADVEAGFLAALA